MENYRDSINHKDNVNKKNKKVDTSKYKVSIIKMLKDIRFSPKKDSVDEIDIEIDENELQKIAEEQLKQREKTEYN